MKLIVNVLAVISSGMFAGVLFAIGVLLGGYWKELSAVAFLDSFNTFLPLVPRAIAVGLVAVVGLTGSVWLSWGIERFVRCGCWQQAVSGCYSFLLRSGSPRLTASLRLGRCL